MGGFTDGVRQTREGDRLRMGFLFKHRVQGVRTPNKRFRTRKGICRISNWICLHNDSR
jgi:hypothetical protein